MTKKNKQISLVQYIITAFAVILILLTISNLSTSNYNNDVLGADTTMNITQINKEVSFWEEFLIKTPTYADGWIQLSILNSKLGNINKAEEYITIAKNIDYTR